MLVAQTPPHYDVHRCVPDRSLNMLDTEYTKDELLNRNGLSRHPFPVLLLAICTGNRYWSAWAWLLIGNREPFPQDLRVVSPWFPPRKDTPVWIYYAHPHASCLWHLALCRDFWSRILRRCLQSLQLPLFVDLGVRLPVLNGSVLGYAKALKEGTCDD